MIVSPMGQNLPPVSYFHNVMPFLLPISLMLVSSYNFKVQRPAKLNKLATQLIFIAWNFLILKNNN
jgi:hypothetical protein